MRKGHPRGGTSSKWARWRELSRVERRATLTAAALIPAFALCVRIGGLQRPLALIDGRKLRTSYPSGRATLETASLLTRCVSRASSHGPYAGNCLSRSLTLLWLLRAAGVAGELRVGARTADGRLEAHAWVEFEGKALNDAETVGSRFAPFLPFPR